MNSEKPLVDNALDEELSIEDTDVARARIGSSKDPNSKAAYVRDVDKASAKSKSTGDLRTLSKWISKQREIAELKGESVRVRTKRKR